MNTPVGNVAPKFDAPPKRRTVEIELPTDAPPPERDFPAASAAPSPLATDDVLAEEVFAFAETPAPTAAGSPTATEPPSAAAGDAAVPIPIHRSAPPTDVMAERLSAATEESLAQSPTAPADASAAEAPPAVAEDASGAARKTLSEDETIQLLMDLAGLQEDLERAREQTNSARRHVELVKEQLAKTTAEKTVVQEKLHRLTAEFDNYRRRAEREKAEAMERGRQAVILKTLEVLDNLERALQTGRAEGGTLADFLAGVELIQRQLADSLAGFGVRPIAAVGEVFDPTVHEAIATDETNEYKPNTVLAELKRGYMLGDRLLRPAMVRVAVRPTAS